MNTLQNWDAAHKSKGVEAWCLDSYQDTGVVYSGAEIWADKFFDYYNLPKDTEFLQYNYLESLELQHF